MREESIITDLSLPWETARARRGESDIHLVLQWSLYEPELIGEVICVDAPLCIGRGGPLSDDPAPRALPKRMRPGREELCPPILNSRISRLQLVVRPVGADKLDVKS